MNWLNFWPFVFIIAGILLLVFRDVVEGWLSTFSTGKLLIFLICMLFLCVVLADRMLEQVGL